ncbi:MAG: hypothetical protein ACFB10_11845 [Salibacteraceae bacterium]
MIFYRLFSYQWLYRSRGDLLDFYFHSRNKVNFASLLYYPTTPIKHAQNTGS